METNVFNDMALCKHCSYSIFLLILPLAISGCLKKPAGNINTKINIQKNINTSKNPTSLSTPTPIPSPSPTDTPVEVITSNIDTSNWLTYRNEKYGFEVKYPEGWYSANWQTPVLERRFHFSPGPIGPNNDYGVYLDIRKKPRVDLGYDENVNQIYRSWGYETSELENAIIAGKKILKFDFYYFFENDKYILSFNFVPAGEIPLEIYNAMLLTFRPIDTH